MCVHKQWLLAAGALFRNALHLIPLWRQRAVKAATQTHHSSSFDRAETRQNLSEAGRTHDDDCPHKTSCQMYVLTRFMIGKGVPAGNQVQRECLYFCLLHPQIMMQTNQSFQRLRSLKELSFVSNPAAVFNLPNPRC